MLYEPRTGTVIDLRFAEFISFFNSPYYPHRMGTAIDVYPRENLFLNPFEEATVLRVVRVECPKMRVDGVGRDYVTLLLLPTKIVAKVLHVDPGVRVGERLCLHDPVGKTMVTGFLYPWSEPHAHLELRPMHRALGVLSGLRVKVLRLPLVPSTARVHGVVKRIDEFFALIEPVKTSGYGPTPLSTAAQGPWIEGGYPHYGYVALHSYGEGEDLGVTRVATKSFEPRRKNFVSASTYLGRPLIKIVFDNPRALDLREGDYLELPTLTKSLRVLATGSEEPNL